MREIKFRGKRVDNGEWVSGDLVHWRNEENAMQIIPEKFGCCVDDKGNIILLESPFCCKVIPESVGQYTGSKDDKGADVYEGDYLCVSGYSYEEPEEDWEGTVAMGHFGWCIDGVNSNGDKQWHHLTEIGGSYTTKYEVIGNIHDNPSLLEVSQ